MEIQQARKTVVRQRFRAPLNIMAKISTADAFSMHMSRRRRRHLAAKRLFDFVMSGAALIILLPFLVLIAILIKCDSKGPVLFRQNRWGKDQKTIRIYKFRSMYYEQGDLHGIHQTKPQDPRVTRLGAWLRRSNIDELPQLLNVLMGDMSLVGPRCHAIGMKAGGMLYEDLVPHYHLRHSMRPGLTGLAQMRGLRGPTDKAYRAQARISNDLYYVENFSFWFDLKIILGTIKNELINGSGF